MNRWTQGKAHDRGRSPFLTAHRTAFGVPLTSGAATPPPPSTPPPQASACQPVYAVGIADLESTDDDELSGTADPATSTEALGYRTSPATSQEALGYRTSPATSEEALGYRTSPATSQEALGYQTSPAAPQEALGYQTSPAAPKEALGYQTNPTDSNPTPNAYHSGFAPSTVGTAPATQPTPAKQPSHAPAARPREGLLNAYVRPSCARGTTTAARLNAPPMTYEARPLGGHLEGEHSLALWHHLDARTKSAADDDSHVTVSVHRLADDELDRYRVTVDAEGKLRWRGELLDTTGARTQFVGRDGERFIYVMTPQGELYAADNLLETDSRGLAAYRAELNDELVRRRESGALTVIEWRRQPPLDFQRPASNAPTVCYDCQQTFPQVHMVWIRGVELDADGRATLPTGQDEGVSDIAGGAWLCRPCEARPPKARRRRSWSVLRPIAVELDELKRIQSRLPYPGAALLTDVLASKTRRTITEGEALQLKLALRSSTPRQVELFHHSSLAQGNPVAAAGELRVAQGIVTEISNDSGHFMPPPRFLLQVVTELRRRRADLSQLYLKLATLGRMTPDKLPIYMKDEVDVRPDPGARGRWKDPLAAFRDELARGFPTLKKAPPPQDDTRERELTNRAAGWLCARPGCTASSGTVDHMEHVSELEGYVCPAHLGEYGRVTGCVHPGCETTSAAEALQCVAAAGGVVCAAHRASYERELRCSAEGCQATSRGKDPLRRVRRGEEVVFLCGEHLPKPAAVASAPDAPTNTTPPNTTPTSHEAEG